MLFINLAFNYVAPKQPPAEEPKLPVCGCAPHCKTKEATVEDPTCDCICPQEPTTTAAPPADPVMLPLCGCAPPCKTKEATIEDPTCHCDCPEPETLTIAPTEPLLPLCGCAPPCKTKLATPDEPTCHCICPDDVNTGEDTEGGEGGGQMCREFYCFAGCDAGFRFKRDENGCQMGCECGEWSG